MEIPFEEMPLMLGEHPVGRYDGHVVVEPSDDPRVLPEALDVVVYSDIYDHEQRQWARRYVSLRERFKACGRTFDLLGDLLWTAAVEDTRLRIQEKHAERWGEEIARREARQGIRPDRLLKSEVV
jgi:hypothetical protein